MRTTLDDLAASKHRSQHNLQTATPHGGSPSKIAENGDWPKSALSWTMSRPTPLGTSVPGGNHRKAQIVARADPGTQRLMTRRRWITQAPAPPRSHPTCQTARLPLLTCRTAGVPCDSPTDPERRNRTEYRTEQNRTRMSKAPWAMKQIPPLWSESAVLGLDFDEHGGRCWHGPWRMWRCAWPLWVRLAEAPRNQDRRVRREGCRRRSSATCEGQQANLIEDIVRSQFGGKSRTLCLVPHRVAHLTLHA